MTHEEIIAQLESLRAHCREMIHDDEPDDIWQGDVEALDFAIIESKRGAVRAFCFNRHACSDCPLQSTFHEHHCYAHERADEDGLDAILKAIREVSGV